MKTYPSRVDTLNLGKWGAIQFKQWLFGVEPPPLTEAWVDHVARLVPKGSFAIDIGAFTGDTAIPMALAVGRDGLVLAFEPGPASFHILVDNMNLNRLPQIVCSPTAVMPKAGDYTFHYTDTGYINGGFSSSLDISPAGCGNPIPWIVQGVHLTDYLAAHYADWLPKLSFIKIDTEGYDKELLKANRELIARHKPTLQVEAYPFLSERERRDLADTIESLGYVPDVPRALLLAPNPNPFDVICKPL